MSYLDDVTIIAELMALYPDAYTNAVDARLALVCLANQSAVEAHVRGTNEVLLLLERGPLSALLRVVTGWVRAPGARPGSGTRARRAPRTR